MTKISLFTLIFAVPVFCFGQIEMDRQVIGCFGTSSVLSGQTLISYTGGESAVTTLSGSNQTLTQGFHQPHASSLLSFNLELVNTSCPTASDGSAAISDLMGCAPPYIIEWSNGDEGLISPDLKPGLYSVTVFANGCKLIQEFEILSGPESNCVLTFFNAFSPNGDGQNETWEIGNIEVPEFSDNEVEIFNRWGQVVWSGSGYNNADVVFEGKHKNGEFLPDGTYFYIATIRNVVYNGFIELTK